MGKCPHALRGPAVARTCWFFFTPGTPAGSGGIMPWHTEHFGNPHQFGYKGIMPIYTAHHS
jgi:hypothetical protein